MKNILVKDIVKICKGKLICGDENEVCENFSKDTREINQGDIFLGIKGERVNGSILYKKALENGAKGCILQDVEIDEKEIDTYANKFIILVPNVVKALQELAEYKRSLYNIPVIGITGSVGKTSTKDIIASVLSTKYKVLKTEGNYNNEIGLPLTILKLKEHNAMVLEMGMSAFGEISLLTKIARPTTAVITTIGSSHIGILGSRENILKAKLEILEGLEDKGNLIFNNDNDLLSLWNMNNKNIHIMEDSSSFEIKKDNKIYTIKVPVAGKHFVYNSLAAIAVGLEYDINMESIMDGILRFTLTQSRMEIIKNRQNITIINDCYNASYESVKVALEYLSSLKSQRKIAVLGDVLELGNFSHEMHKKIGEEVVKNKIDIIVTVGDEAKIISNTVKEKDKNIKVYTYEKNSQAIELLRTILNPKDVVLVKASNGMHFNEIIEAIKE